MNTIISFALALAGQIGAPLPTPPPPVVVPETISGYYSVSGNGSLTCMGTQRSGWVDIRANLPVTMSDGASGTVPVGGSVYVNGSCQNGGGWVNGGGRLSGSGTLYRGGKPAGTARFSGNVNINQYVSGSYAWINQTVYFEGRFEPSSSVGD